MRALLQRKGTRLLPASYGFLRWLRNLWQWWKPDSPTLQWSHRETHSIKTLAHLGVTVWIGHSATWAATEVLDCQRQNWRHVRGAEMILGWLLEELSSQAAHRPTKQFHWWLLIPEKFNLKWETESQKQKWRMSESQPLTNTLADPVQYIYSSYLQVL